MKISSVTVCRSLDVCMSVSPSVRPSVCLPACLSVSLAACLCQSFCLSLSVSPSLSPSLCACLSVTSCFNGLFFVTSAFLVFISVNVCLCLFFRGQSHFLFYVPIFPRYIFFFLFVFVTDWFHFL